MNINHKVVQEKIDKYYEQLNNEKNENFYSEMRLKVKIGYKNKTYYKVAGRKLYGNIWSFNSVLAKAPIQSNFFNLEI